MRSYKVIECTQEGAAECAKAIGNGAVVVFPTDTVYGIGCDPRSDAAVERIFAIKGRKEDNPLPLLAHSLQVAEQLVMLGRSGRLLASCHWPGGLTLVAPLADKSISTKVTAGKSSIAIRVPANDCILSVLAQCRYLVGTSANRSGEKAPISAQDVVESSLDGFDILLDGGRVQKEVPSTIVDLATGRVTREGAVKSAEIYNLLGQATR